MSAAGRKPDGPKRPASGEGGGSKKPGAGKGDGKKKTSKARAAEARLKARRLGLLVFGAGLVVLFVLIAATTGIGKPSVPDEGIAVVSDVPGGTVTITEEEFGRALEQMSAQAQIGDVPEREDPQWNEVAQAAMNDLLDIAWIRGEADRLDVTVSERQINDELGQVAVQNFNCDAEEDPFECQEFRQFLRDSNYSREEVLDRIEVGLMSNEIQTLINEGAGDPSESDLRTYYETFQDQFRVPASTDIRVIQNEERSEVVQAQRKLEEDQSPETWEEVASEHSTDPASSEEAGVRQGVTEGMFEAPVQDAIDSAEPGELVGPIEADSGFYLLQVDARNPEGIQGFDEVRDQLDQQIAQQLIVSEQTDFVNQYQDRWSSKTVCAEGYLLERCSNSAGENDFLTNEMREQIAETERDQAPALAGKRAWPKPPNTMTVPFGAVTINGTQIICHLADSPEGQFFPLTGVAPPQRPHPPGSDESMTEVPEGMCPEDLPPTCGATDPMAMLGGGLG